MKRFIFLLSILWGAVSCSVDNCEDCVTLCPTDDKIEIPVSASFSVYVNDIHYFNDSNGTELLTMSSREDPTCFQVGIYDLKNTSSVKFLSFDLRKYNVGMITSHCMLDQNTLYLATASKSILVIDSTGSVRKEYEWSKLENGRIEIASFLSSPYNPVVIKNGKLYCAQHRVVPEVPIGFTVDTATSSVESLPLQSPIVRDDEQRFYNEAVSRVYDGNNFVYSFADKSDIYVTEDYKNFRSYCAKSKLIGDLDESGVKPTADIEEYKKSFYTCPEYSNIVYDSYNEVFYRFCFAKCDLKGVGIGHFEYMLCKGDFSIQIIDKEFKVIGETIFSRGKYAPKIFFVDKRGLWLSENNYERDDMDDDELVFRCLKLEKMK